MEFEPEFRCADCGTLLYPGESRYICDGCDAERDNTYGEW